MVYLPRWERRHRILWACRVPWSRLGSNRLERHSGMMRVMHCLDRRCGIRNPLKPFSKSGHVLFSIPRTLVLSTRSCALLNLFGSDSWTSFQLHKGWAGLIFCMMWEESRVERSKWFHYLGMSCFAKLAWSIDSSVARAKFHYHHTSTHRCFGVTKNWPNFAELPSQVPTPTIALYAQMF